MKTYKITGNHASATHDEEYFYTETGLEKKTVDKVFTGIKDYLNKNVQAQPVLDVFKEHPNVTEATADYYVPGGKQSVQYIKEVDGLDGDGEPITSSRVTSVVSSDTFNQNPVCVQAKNDMMKGLASG